MNSEAKKLWLKALRSGEYSQVRGQLQSDEGYCCLGVACDVAVDAGVNVEVKYVLDIHADDEPCDKMVSGYEYDGKGGTLPLSVQHWLGVGDQWAAFDPSDDWREAHGFGTGDPRRTQLADLNDRGYTFDEIADIIEEWF